MLVSDLSIPRIGPHNSLQQNRQTDLRITIHVTVVYMGRYEVVLRGDYP